MLFGMSTKIIFPEAEADVDERALLTSQQAAALCGVHSSSIKRWCDAGELACQLTPGGHRRIDPAALMDFAAKRELQTELDPFGDEAPLYWQAVSEAVDGDGMSTMVALWLERLRQDRPEHLAASMQLLLRWELGLTRLFDEGLMALMHQVGEDWVRGRIRIGDEHRISEQLMDALHDLRGWLRRAEPGMRPGDPRARFASARNGGSPPVALVAAAPGNRHRVGAFMVRLLLESRGWRVRYLGADIPADEISIQQRLAGADLVCISFGRPQHAGDAKRVAGQLAQGIRQPYHLAMGGSGLWPHLPTIDEPVFRSSLCYDALRPFEQWLDRDLARTLPDEPNRDGGRT